MAAQSKGSLEGLIVVGLVVTDITWGVILKWPEARRPCWMRGQVYLGISTHGTRDSYATGFMLVYSITCLTYLSILDIT
jgi:hypothetical protein